MDLPGHKPTLAPGMTQVIEAGEAYTLVDDKGDELELIGKLDSGTIAFLRAYDIWIGLFMRLGNEPDVVKHAWRTLGESWSNLPKHARDTLIR